MISTVETKNKHNQRQGISITTTRSKAGTVKVMRARRRANRITNFET